MEVFSVILQVNESAQYCQSFHLNELWGWGEGLLAETVLYISVTGYRLGI